MISYHVYGHFQLFGKLEQEEPEFEDCLCYIINMELNIYMFKMTALF